MPEGIDVDRRGFLATAGMTIVAAKLGMPSAASTAASYKNPDHVAIVIHNYRWRIGLARGDPKYDSLENKLYTGPLITQPTITIASDFDGQNAGGTAYRSKFTGKYSHQLLDGIGHDVPQEAPQAYADAITEVARY